MRYIVITVCLLVVVICILKADIGCMDTSKHLDTHDGYDYKTLHYVSCSCPCHKMRHLNRKGKCFMCGHYLKPNTQIYDMSFLRTKAVNNLFSSIPTFKYK